MWAKYATPPPPAGRRGHFARPVERLEHEPGAEHEQGRQLDDREEDDDEQQRDHARAWIQQRVAAEHGGHRPARADGRHGRVGIDHGLREHRHERRPGGRRR